MKKLFNCTPILFLALLFFSCNKPEVTVPTNAVTVNKNSTKSNSRTRGTSLSDSLNYYLNLASPVRDIIAYENGRLSTASSLMTIGGGGFPPPPATCGGITITGTFVSNPPTGWCGTDIPPTYVPGMKDYWNNDIWFTAQYGSDTRQMYYIYYPSNKNPNSPIIVLIHGGGWTTGPNPETVNGWGSVYTPAGTETSNNLVKNLLAQGYVVVAPLYRLVQYGDNNTDIMANTITIQDQINDIDAAITHMKTNFPSCLNLNVNSVQVMGESAGAQLALMFAYTKANTGYIKSVVSVAGPTNMNQFANWMMVPPYPFTCGTDFVLSNPNTTIYTHFPFYSVYDPNAANANLVVTGLVNPLTCTVNNIQIFAGLIFGIPVFTTIIPSSNNGSKRITNSFRQLESCVRQIFTNPLSNTTLSSISPSVALNASRIVPTFIIHGTDDWLVPYSKATSTMDSKLSSTGGIIGTYSSTTGNPIPVSSFYATSTSKHLIKLYTNSNHDVSNNAQTQPDILTWFNGHK